MYFLVRYIVFFSKECIIETGELIMNLEFKNTNLILNKAISQVWKSKQYSYENFARPDHGLLYLFSGNITYKYDNHQIEVKPGNIVYLPKSSKYVVDFNLKNGVVEDYLINFDVMEGNEFTDLHMPTVVLNDNTWALLDCFKEVVDAYNEIDKPFLINSKFYLALNSLQTAIQYKSSNADRFKFEKAARKLSENFELSIEDISKELYISRSTFQKKFIEYFGMPPVEYRSKKRLKKAKLLLETTDMPIKEVSDSLGFYDIAYFYKVFKKTFAITPKEYRETKKTIF